MSGDLGRRRCVRCESVNGQQELKAQYVIAGTLVNLGKVQTLPIASSLEKAIGRLCKEPIWSG